MSAPHVNTVELLWKKYRNACYGADPLPETQERETRQAFFAGALCAFTAVSEISALPEETAVKVMDVFYEDCRGCVKENVMAAFNKMN